jgi:hypothetical protein
MQQWDGVVPVCRVSVQLPVQRSLYIPNTNSLRDGAIEQGGVEGRGGLTYLREEEREVRESRDRARP